MIRFDGRFILTSRSHIISVRMTRSQHAQRYTPFRFRMHIIRRMRTCSQPLAIPTTSPDRARQIRAFVREARFHRPVCPRAAVLSEVAQSTRPVSGRAEACWHHLSWAWRAMLWPRSQGITNARIFPKASQRAAQCGQGHRWALVQSVCQSQIAPRLRCWRRSA